MNLMNAKLTLGKSKKITRPDLARGLMRAYKIRSRDLAKQIGVPESNVCAILAGRKKSRRIQQAIAFAVGVPYEELWGKPK
ncbi:hypothetical protein KAR91_08505 [Candidatus Pacearchaeota archaeon]|nr:hypothetical protein [Candidatus Pacearchaeota archaeon]